MKQQVLILGAGASKPFGLPVMRGPDSLMHQIFSQVYDRFVATAQTNPSVVSRIPVDKIHRFFDAYRHSDSSIDNFTEKHLRVNEYAGMIANYAITSVITKCEHPGLFSRPEANNDWLSILWSRLNEGISSAEKFVERCDNLKIITFNYDRSLEYCLYMTIKANYPELIISGKEPESCIPIKIYHVYGRTNSLSSLPYGKSVTEYRFLEGQISLISAARQNQQNAMAEGWIEQANEIFFLGMSYIPENLTILGFGKNNPYVSSKLVWGTVMGLSTEEIKRAQSRIYGFDLRPLVPGFEIQDCYTLMKNHFFVD